MAKSKTRLFCEERDRPSIELSKKKYSNSIPGEDYVECAICGFCSSTLSMHFARHGYTAKQYKEEFKEESNSSKYRNMLSEKSRGEKNPWYQHGGKFSPFSKKFIKFDENNIEELVKKANKSKKDNNNNPLTLIYYTSRGKPEQEAKELLKQRQNTFTLEKCIERYGMAEGIETWETRQINWQETMKSKPKEEIQRINALKVGRGSSVSFAEKEIYNWLKNKGIDVKTQLQLKYDRNYFMYDIYFQNKIIEYNGDFWHCNPQIYKKDYVNYRTKRTAEQIWDKDRKKFLVAEQQKYEVLTIWEKDYRNDKEKELHKCLNFLIK